MKKPPDLKKALVLDILKTNPHGITRRELAFKVYGIWTPDHDRSVRLAVSALRNDGAIIVSSCKRGTGYCLSEDKADVSEYIRTRWAAIRTEAATLKKVARAHGLINQMELTL